MAGTKRTRRDDARRRRRRKAEPATRTPRPAAVAKAAPAPGSPLDLRARFAIVISVLAAPIVLVPPRVRDTRVVPLVCLLVFTFACIWLERDAWRRLATREMGMTVGFGALAIVAALASYPGLAALATVGAIVSYRIGPGVASALALGAGATLGWIAAPASVYAIVIGLTLPALGALIVRR